MKKGGIYESLILTKELPGMKDLEKFWKYGACGKRCRTFSDGSDQIRKQ